MKKILTCLLVLALLVGTCAGLSVSAEEKNLLNADDAKFEGGKTSGDWGVLAGGKLSVIDNPAGDGKVLAYTDLPDASKSWATPTLDLYPTLTKGLDGSGEEIYFSFDIYPDADVSSTVRIRTKAAEDFSITEEAGQNYCSLCNFSAPANEWTHVKGSFDVADEDLELKNVYWNFCFDGLPRSGAGTICFDNVYFGLDVADVDQVNEEELPEITPVTTRFDETYIGTIRWDAFCGSGDDTRPCSQVARVLSPAQYHWQTPFFGDINEDGTVSFPEYTLDTWEAETKYAIEGGLDYFAYLWYETTDDMSKPRKMHLQSPNKDKIKMCGVLETIRSDKSMSELWEAMKDSCYLRLDGRPVVFLYGLNESWDSKKINGFRQAAANAGIKEALYLVGMYTNYKDVTLFMMNVEKGVDAFSWYSIGATKKDETYAELAENCENVIKGLAALAPVGKVDLIPSFTAGRDTRARIQTGVSWVGGDPNAENDKDKPYGNMYALPPTMEELQKHIEFTLSFAQNNPEACKTNMVLSYGWNEHEEGGWLCPTLAVDENGNQLYNEDGTKKINNERLEALTAAIKAVKEGPAVTEAPTEAPTETEAPGATNEPQNTEDKPFNWLFVIIPAAVVVVAAVVIAVVAAKKKKEK